MNSFTAFIVAVFIMMALALGSILFLDAHQSKFEPQSSATVVQVDDLKRYGPDEHGVVCYRYNVGLSCLRVNP